MCNGRLQPIAIAIIVTVTVIIIGGGGGGGGSSISVIIDEWSESDKVTLKTVNMNEL